MSEPEVVPAPKKSVVPMVLGIGCVAILCAGVPCAGVVSSIAIPNYVAMQLKAKRSELVSNVNGIKISELSYDAMNDGFVAVGHPPGLGELGEEPRRWMGGADWVTLNWAPDGDVRGVYWVEVSGDDFVVHGVADLDGDGVAAEYTATSSVSATQVTPEDVY
jgi:hypothetical protein